MEKTPIKILGAEPYDKVRELCHQKDMSAYDYVKLIGDRFYPFLPEKSVLIPVPGHDGKASHTLQLCSAILVSTATANCEDGVVKKYAALCDCLCCPPHPSFCELKHNGEDIADIPLVMQWLNEVEKWVLDSYINDGCVPILVDNVVDTGKTARACMDRIGRGPLQVIAIGNTGRQLL